MNSKQDALRDAATTNGELGATLESLLHASQKEVDGLRAVLAESEVNDQRFKTRTQSQTFHC